MSLVSVGKKSLDFLWSVTVNRAPSIFSHPNRSAKISAKLYKNGFRAELIGNIKPTVQAYISGPTVNAPHCTSKQDIPMGTQQKKSVKTTADILNAIFRQRPSGRCLLFFTGSFFFFFLSFFLSHPL